MIHRTNVYLKEGPRLVHTTREYIVQNRNRNKIQFTASIKRATTFFFSFKEITFIFFNNP